MTRDIKATVAELVAKWGDASKDCEEADAFVDQLVASWPSLLAELRRLWAIEEAALALREAYNADKWCLFDEDEAAAALFAALPPRPCRGPETSGGEEAKP